MALPRARNYRGVPTPLKPLCDEHTAPTLAVMHLAPSLED